MSDMTRAPNILMVLTSHARLGQTREAMGVQFEELAVPYYAFLDSGAEVTVASVGDSEVPVDPRSLKPQGQNVPAVDRFLADEAAMRGLRGSVPVGAADPEAYDAVVLPGLHGTMWDLPGSAALAGPIGRMWDGGRVVAAVCHGPAGLVEARDATGRPIVEGRRVASFTNSEEEAAGLTEAVPFLLESRLRELGARFEAGPDFQPFAVADGRLVTGRTRPLRRRWRNWCWRRCATGAASGSPPSRVWGTGPRP